MIKLNNVVINPTLFPDKTSQVWQLDNKLFEYSEGIINYVIDWYFEEESESIWLFQLIDLLYSPNRRIYLNIAYLPYARQDKSISNKGTFALRTFAGMFYHFSVLCEEINIFDPHSDIFEETLGELSGVHNVESRLIDYGVLVDRFKPEIILFPDAGAKTRYEKHFKEFDLPLVACQKVRDQQTGWITSFIVDSDLKPGKGLVIDDLCDGGKTFEILADSIPDWELDLYISHGLFSKGVSELTKRYKNIITTNSLVDPIQICLKGENVVGERLESIRKAIIDPACYFHVYDCWSI